MTVKKDDNSTRKKILNASSKVIAQKGFVGSSVSEIAQEAGIKEPTIYQHFKGKEELLFSTSEQHMQDYLYFLNEHLQGISGAYNKLRKLVWAHLRYSDMNKEYMTLILFECRTNRNFYKSGAYKLIRRYAGILLSILDEGVKEGVFRREVDLRVVRDVIFGLLDSEAISCFVTREIPEAAPDHEDIMQLIDRMLLRKYQRKTLPMEKRQRILQAAVQAFAKKGYSNATISEIAGLADVSEGTVYEYFKNKEDLLFCISERHFQDHLDQLEKNFDINNHTKRLRFFIQHHFQLYLNDPDFLVVFLTLVLFNRQFYKSRAYHSLQRYVQALEEVVQKVIDNGGATKDINVRIFRNMFLGVFAHMTLRWFVVTQGENIDKMGEIDRLTALLTDVLFVRPDQ